MNWPALTINLKQDAGVDLLVAGIIHTTYPPGPTVRADAIKEAQRLAAAYRRTIPVTCNEPGAQYRLAITPDGTITDITNPKTSTVDSGKDSRLDDSITAAPCRLALETDPELLEEALFVDVPNFYTEPPTQRRNEAVPAEDGHGPAEQVYGPRMKPVPELLGWCEFNKQNQPSSYKSLTFPIKPLT